MKSEKQQDSESRIVNSSKSGRSEERIGVFGSYVRGEQNEASDLDILVELEKPVGFVKFLKLENALSQLLDIRVEMVTRKALKPHIGERILQEVRYV